MLRLSLTERDIADDIIITEDTILEIRLSNCRQNINVDVMDNMCLEVLEIDSDTTNTINYTLRDNAQVVVNKIAKNCSDVTTINLIGDKAGIKYYSNIMNFYDNTYKFDVYHKGNYSNSDIYNYCVNFTDSEFKFLVNGSIDKKAIECSCNQDNKIIDIGNGKNYISPNLLVDNNLVNANHAAYIGKFKKDVLFYMKSRGLPEKECEELLIKGFLLGKMNLDDKTKEEFTNLIMSCF